MFTLETASLREALGKSKDWDRYRHRTNADSPHCEVSDIWVRYCDPENLIQGPHESVWYEADFDAKPIVNEALEKLRATQLGGVLITKIAPGKCVHPHKDFGWHAGFYQKLAVCISANHEQSFCFDGEQMRSDDGDCFTFDNAYPHWVLNPSQQERISMIVCFRGMP